MKCEVCNRNWKWAELRAVQIWDKVTPFRGKPNLVGYGDGSTRKENWELNDCYKEIIVCFDCLQEMNFRKYEKPKVKK